MSVNLNLSFEIHDFDRSKSDELFAAAKQFLDAEGLRPPEVLVDFLGTEGYLAGYTVSPVIISASYEWGPRRHGALATDGCEDQRRPVPRAGQRRVRRGDRRRRGRHAGRPVLTRVSRLGAIEVEDKGRARRRAGDVLGGRCRRKRQTVDPAKPGGIEVAPVTGGQR